MSKKNRKSVVYSTNPDFHYDDEDGIEVETLDPSEQKLYVFVDRKNRGGKEVTIVEGFVGQEEDLKTLTKVLKSKCGVGGSVKDNQAIIQGSFKEKVYDLLVGLGYSVKKKGGN